MNIEEFGEEVVVRTTSCGIASFASKVFEVSFRCGIGMHSVGPFYPAFTLKGGFPKF